MLAHPGGQHDGVQAAERHGVGPHERPDPVGVQLQRVGRVRVPALGESTHVSQVALPREAEQP